MLKRQFVALMALVAALFAVPSFAQTTAPVVSHKTTDRPTVGVVDTSALASDQDPIISTVAKRLKLTIVVKKGSLLFNDTSRGMIDITPGVNAMILIQSGKAGAASFSAGPDEADPETPVMLALADGSLLQGKVVGYDGAVYHVKSADKELDISKRDVLTYGIIIPPTVQARSTAPVAAKATAPVATKEVAAVPAPPAHVYTFRGGTWFDETEAPASDAVGLKLSKAIGHSWVLGKWYTESGGYSAGPSDISQANDYSRAVGSPDDPKLSTGWTGPKGDRTVHVKDYYRTTKSGKVVHVHGYYRSKGH